MRHPLELAGTSKPESTGLLGAGPRELPLVAVEEENAVSRRGFLRLAGFAVAGATVAGCQRAPVRNAVTTLSSPDELLPGRSYDYASTCGGCSAGCGLVVKNRDGRPIKFEGNPDHPLSKGGLCAPGQASLLGLYDQQRLRNASQDNQPIEWQSVDQELIRQLEAIRKSKGAVRFLTGPGVGPSTRAMIRQFLSTFSDGRHIVQDPRSCSVILDAHFRTHNVRVLPQYHLDKAEAIVSFDADFLGTWISPVEYTAAYQVGRRLDEHEGRLSYHAQFEPLLTLTGSKADQRHIVAPGELGAVMNQLAVRLAKKAALPPLEAPQKQSPVSAQFLDHLANILWQNRGRSLILCGSQDVELQVLTNHLNHILGNYGSTVDIVQPSNQRDGNDRALAAFLQELQENKHKAKDEGKIAAVFTYQCNLVHDLPEGARIGDDLKGVSLIVSLSPRLDETARLANFVCPDHHFLESWGDAEPVNGVVSLVQPAIDPLTKTRSVMESLAVWMGKPRLAHDIVREHWEKEVYPRSTSGTTFTAFWDRTLMDGFTRVAPKPIRVSELDPATMRLAKEPADLPGDTYSLVLYSKVGMPDSSHAYNPWLHELPDPISKVTWDNYACLSPATAKTLGLADGDLVRLDPAGEDGDAARLELPVLVQAGQHDRVIGVALGYGSQLSGRFANIGPQWFQSKSTVGANGLVGKNAAPLLRWAEGSLQYAREGVRLTKIGGQQPLASTQGYNLLTVPPRFTLPADERRPIVRETTLEAYQQNKSQDSPVLPVERKEDLWPDDHANSGPNWGMTIDLHACTGCSACVIACQAENNIPVVGKDEVRRQREMHWLRIDRYYSERDSGVDVVHQPMLCQHCGNAPCEVVCPVLATVHSEDGLNQQVYNRCVGTRYCANNCPYKVRRFNWFEYAHDDLLQNLVLNPDVTVRSRGVMEKCTFCVQRIQEAKIAAGGAGHVPADGAIQTACQQSCPAGAIVFGNLNDPKSRVARLAAGKRSYQVLGELNVKPSVNYLAVVRNRPANGEGEKNG